jgi:hypothetical protein
VTADERRAVYSLLRKAEAALKDPRVDRFGRNDGDDQDTRAFIVLVGDALTEACGKSSPSIIATMAKVLLSKEIGPRRIARSRTHAAAGLAAKKKAKRQHV